MIASSIYCLPADVLDEGADAVVSNIVNRAGVAGLTVAATYHTARDVYPHNPLHRVAVTSPGSFYRINKLVYQDAVLRPIASASARGRDILDEACSAGARWGLDVSAWLVLLHRDEWTPRAMLQVNCFGDVVPGALCPARRAVQEYVLRVVGEVCSYPIHTLRLEALHYHGLVHGGHHERCADDLGQLATFLLGVCWCESCLDRAHGSGVDGQRLAAKCREFLRSVFEGRGSSGPATSIRLKAVLGSEIMAYMAVRRRTVTDLAREVALKAKGYGVRVTFVDQTLMIGIRGVGETFDRAMARAAWELGVDHGGLAAAGVGVEGLVYVAALGEAQAAIEWYKAQVGLGRRLSIVLQPGSQDPRFAGDLEERITCAAVAGSVEVNFYAYGLYRLGALDVIGSALRRVRARCGRVDAAAGIESCSERSDGCNLSNPSPTA